MKLKLLTILLIFANFTAKAQIQNPIKWSYASKRLSETEVILFIKADINKGWHIYSTFQKDGGPQKTSFTFSKDKNLTLVGKVNEPKPIKKFEEVFGIDVLYFDKSVTFSQKIKVKTKSAFLLKGKVEFMACTDQECLPPNKVEFSIPVS